MVDIYNNKLVIDKSNPNSGYQYIKRGRLYVCVQQSIVLLILYVLIKNKSLGLPTFGVSRAKGFTLIKTLIRHRLNMKSENTRIELPIQGNLALDVHQGIKIFLFGEMKVAKIIAPEICRDSLTQEMDAVRVAGKLAVAPRISQYNYEKRWYIEDYVPGGFLYLQHKLPSEELYRLYEKEIIECLMAMILALPSQSMTLIEYVQKLVTIIFREELPKLNLDQQRTTIIQKFIQSTEMELLGSDTTQNIELIFSHGDFSLQNILRTKNTLKVIDWEGAKSRSILYDFYNFFMTELYYERSNTDLVALVYAANSKLQLQLTKQAPSMVNEFMLSKPLYLRLFFLERVLMLLERDMSERNINVLMRSIKIFNTYYDKAVKHNND